MEEREKEGGEGHERMCSLSVLFSVYLWDYKHGETHMTSTMA